jgi:transposase
VVTGADFVSSNSPVLSGAGDHPGAGSPEAVDPAPRPVRRSFTAAYRARVVAEYEAAPHGSKAAVLRREGLYQSQIREWTQARDAVARGQTATRRRPHRAAQGSAGGKDDPVRLRAENQRLVRELAKSQAVVEIMGKLQGYAGDRCQEAVSSSPLRIVA